VVAASPVAVPQLADLQWWRRVDGGRENCEKSHEVKTEKSEIVLLTLNTFPRRFVL